MRQLATSQPHSQGAGLYIRTAVQYAGCMLVLTLAVVLPTAWFGIRNFSLSDPEGGQLVRDSLEAEHAHAFKRAAEIALEGLGTATPAQPQQTIAVEALKLYYVAGRTSAEDADRSGNVLTVSNIQRIAALEDELVSLGRWPEVCLRQRGQLECAPLLSAVPYLRHATNESELRSSIDDLYQTLEGNPEPHLGPDPDPALTLALALALTLTLTLTLALNLSLGSRGSPLDGLKASWFFEQEKATPSRYESCAPLACAYYLSAHLRPYRRRIRGFSSFLWRAHSHAWGA